eukprot:12218251-Ditylum_brightwellii.AAC.1
MDLPDLQDCTGQDDDDSENGDLSYSPSEQGEEEIGDSTHNATTVDDFDISNEQNDKENNKEINDEQNDEENDKDVSYNTEPTNFASSTNKQNGITEDDNIVGHDDDIQNDIIVTNEDERNPYLIAETNTVWTQKKRGSETKKKGQNNPKQVQLNLHHHDKKGKHQLVTEPIAHSIMTQYHVSKG